MIEKPCTFGIPSKKQALCQPVTNYTYWPVLSSFNNWSIIQLSQKSTPFEAFEEVHQVVLDGIIDHMALLVQYGKYGSINTADSSTNGYYVIKLISEAYTLKNNTTFGGKIITASDLVVKEKYLCSMQDSNNWYWGQHTQQQAITVPICKIINPRLDVVGITYVQDTPKSVCNRIQEKNPYKYSLFI